VALKATESRTLQVEIPEETARQLELWSSQTGKSIQELVAQALTLLRYAIDRDTTLIKQEPSGDQVRLVVK
jgi:hypothetical protein